MSSGATSSAGRAKKDWERAWRCWEGVVAMGVAIRGMGGDMQETHKEHRQVSCKILRVIDGFVLCPRNPKRRRYLRHPKVVGAMGAERTQ